MELLSYLLLTVWNCVQHILLSVHICFMLFKYQFGKCPFTAYHSMSMRNHTCNTKQHRKEIKEGGQVLRNSVVKKVAVGIAHRQITVVNFAAKLSRISQIMRGIYMHVRRHIMQNRQCSAAKSVARHLIMMQISLPI